MLKFIIAIAALAITSPALAQEDQSRCQVIEDIARTVMRARQSNQSMSRVMQIAREEFPGAERLVEAIIMGAYEKPAYSTPENQEREISDYANYWARLCFESEKRKR
jgi:hypothetical protein